MALKFCTHPHLVGLNHELPTDPRVAYEGASPVVGCNHLVCSRCGVVVRHADARATTSNYPPGTANSEKLYDASHPESSPLLDNRPFHAESRAYFCRCDWADVHLGGIKSLGSIDAMWSCGGHGEPHELADAAHARAQEAAKVVAPVAALPVTPRVQPPPRPVIAPVASVPVESVAPPPPPAVARIKLRYASTVNPEFATASELRDCLLASYPAAAFFGGPLIGINRDDTIPAWGWLADLIRMRSDWWLPLGKALEHATRDGGDIAQRALADFCGGFNESVALLPWTSKIAASYPDAVTTWSPATGWGSDDHRLASIIRDQERYLAGIRSPDVFLDGYAKGGKPIRARLTNEDELRAVLDESARAGRFHLNGTGGPWSWLGFELMRRDEWMADALVRIIKTIEAEPHITAALDWFSEQRDLWRFQSVLAGWHAKPPAWSSISVTAKPKGWQRKMRVQTWHEPETLGDVARQAYWRAVQQHATPPIVDLP